MGNKLSFINRTRGTWSDAIETIIGHSVMYLLLLACLVQGELAITAASLIGIALIMLDEQMLGLQYRLHLLLGGASAGSDVYRFCRNIRAITRVGKYTCLGLGTASVFAMEVGNHIFIAIIFAYGFALFSLCQRAVWFLEFSFSEKTELLLLPKSSDSAKEDGSDSGHV